MMKELHLPTSRRVLIVEDQAPVQRLLQRLLAKNGYEAVVAADAETGLQALEEAQPDLIILDVGLPEMDGLSLCKIIRVTYDVPILMVSGRGTTQDLVLGLDVGADDYLAKPFQEPELMARVRALLRRSQAQAAPQMVPVVAPEPREGFQCGPLQVDLRSHMVLLNGRPVDLTPLEFQLLQVLCRDAGRAFTRERLLDLVWGDDYEGGQRLVDTHVKHLRRKLALVDPSFQPITSVRGVGYRFQL
jgi:DNA-binding response OmpR family regulator